ncbi:hypothetical protein PAXRUDRAFT_834694 [Paxillus rubicundulus Ve08.2h10]|uniref:Uncharacterized protein n=1 Tax=Paxillus rubicundulus Ve08.2h10 TaxID=930991 RepID=A0A0D0D3Q8_9AGAM|nr:hypothetical protein PAXRUDRAFT_834694 [Paxillus rubicundulus Ve08.2h10]
MCKVGVRTSTQRSTENSMISPWYTQRNRGYSDLYGNKASRRRPDEIEKRKASCVAH